LGALGIDVPSRRLSACQDHFGLKSLANHSAEDDARCVAELLRALIDEATRRGMSTLGDVGCDCDWPSEWPQITPSRKFHSRSSAREQTAPEDTYLGQLIRRLPRDELSKDDNIACMYFDTLDRALEDRRLSEDESDLLFSLANGWGLTQEAVIRLHKGYFSSLVRVALADGVISKGERADLDEVAHCLALGQDDVEQTLFDIDEVASASSNLGSAAPTSLKGMSVCFTGELICRIDGQPITRAMAERFASNAGLTVANSVTKKLDILVVADPDSMSGKAKKARDYGTRIMAERVFWNAIGIPAQ
jgi:DNA polymerase III subunit epsilon